MTLDALRGYMNWLAVCRPIEVASWAYCLNLAMLAHAMGSKSILEVGQGWGWSGTAFATAISERKGAHIYSIDSSPRMKPECTKYIESTGVAYTFEKVSSTDFTSDKTYDLIYIDTNADYDGLDEMIGRFKPALNDYGIVVLDGFSGEEGTTRIVNNSRHFTYLPLFYCDIYAHAVSIPTW